MRHRVPVYGQTSVKLCWEACGRMLWAWRYAGLSGYRQRAGKFLEVGTGLTEVEMNRFYRALGLRSLSSPRLANLRHALAFSPVIFTWIDSRSGHALVATGFAGGSIAVNDPCARETVNFETDADSCEGAAGSRSSQAVLAELGGFIWYW